MRDAKPIEATIIGGGMITNDLILPSIYHLPREGVVEQIRVCALSSGPLSALAGSAEIREAFPHHSFTPHPALSEPADRTFPNLYKEVLDLIPAYQAVIVAVPDPLHYSVVMEALRRDQHVLCVKPLVLEYSQAAEIGRQAWQRGLFVGVEYHKRFDRRALIARRRYRLGHFGEFAMGEAKMIEPWYYRESNFATWFTCENTDPFVYVGCHYVDLVYFITGLKPTAVSVAGVKGKFPNGNEGFLWAHGRVRFENGALLSVTDGLGYPDDAAGSNEQCLQMFCEGNGRSGLITHDDQYRGVVHSYIDPSGSTRSHYKYINPDFYSLVPWHGAGYKPVGYGYESIAASIQTMHRIAKETAGLDEPSALQKRREIIKEIDDQGLIATPANSHVNELVIEAARMSILNDGEVVEIVHEKTPHVKIREKRMHPGIGA